MTRSFEWLEKGATPDLADLGMRIAACIRKHGYTERSWLTASIKRQIAQFGRARTTMNISLNADGTWV